MPEQNKRDFEQDWWSTDDTNAMLAFVQGQKETLNLAIHHIMQSDQTGPRHASLLPLTLSALRSCDSLGKIGDKFDHFRDIYIISRSLLEVVVNALFILNSEEEVATRAHQHAAQKSLRDFSRRSEIAGWVIQLGPSPEEIETMLDIPEDLREAVAQYTGSKGQEIRQWTPESLSSRIAVAAQNSEPQAGLMLHSAFFIIYRHASEMLHGTLFGSLFEMGLTTPDSGESKPLSRHGDYVNGHLSTVLWADGELVHLLARRLSDHLHAPDLLEQSEALRRQARETLRSGARDRADERRGQDPPIEIRPEG